MSRTNEIAMKARKAKMRARSIMTEIRNRPLSLTLSYGNGSILKKRRKAHQTF